MTVGTSLTVWQQTPYKDHTSRDNLQRLTSPLEDLEASRSLQPRTKAVCYRDRRSITPCSSQRPTLPLAVEKKTSDQRRFTARNSSRSSDSSRVDTTRTQKHGSSSSQQFTEADFFHNLIHNRQQVYQNSTRAFTRNTEQTAQQKGRPTTQNVRVRNHNLRLKYSPYHFGSAEPSDSDDMVRLRSSLDNSSPPVTVSRRRRKILKRAVRSKENAEDSKSKKHDIEATEDARSPKRAKIEDKSLQASNIEENLKGHSQALMIRRKGSSINPVVVDDSDEDDKVPLISGNLARSRRVGRNDETVTPASVPGSLAAIIPNTRCLLKEESLDCELDCPSKSLRTKHKDDLTLSTKMALENAENRHKQEVDELRQKLEAAETKVKTTKEEIEKNTANLQLQWKREENKIRQEIFNAERKCARLYDELEAEKAKSRTAVQERDKLQIKIDNLEKEHRQSLTDHIQLKMERDMYKQERDNLQNERDEFQTQRERLQKECDHLNTELETARTSSKQYNQSNQDDETHQQPHEQETQSRNPFQSSINNPPRTEPNNTTTPPYHHHHYHLPPSPAPSKSSQSTPHPTIDPDAEIKTENIRKTYVKVKRQYDSLHAVAVNLATCTRSMDLSNFGEFGAYCRRLRGILEEERGGAK